MENTVYIDGDALDVAKGYVRLQKEWAIDTDEFEQAASWRDMEKRILQALANGGALRTWKEDSNQADAETETASARWQKFVQQSEIVPRLLF